MFGRGHSAWISPPLTSPPARSAHHLQAMRYPILRPAFPPYKGTFRVITRRIPRQVSAKTFHLSKTQAPNANRAKAKRCDGTRPKEFDVHDKGLWRSSSHTARGSASREELLEEMEEKKEKKKKKKKEKKEKKKEKKKRRPKNQGHKVTCASGSWFLKKTGVKGPQLSAKR